MFDSGSIFILFVGVIKFLILGLWIWIISVFASYCDESLRDVVQLLGRESL